VQPAGSTSAGTPQDLSDKVVTDVRFEEFDLSDDVLDGLEAAGYEFPTRVQIQSIPPILDGRDVVVQARTGTGKTAAFGVPLLELIDRDVDGVQALALTPTRELAQQIETEINRLGKQTPIRAAAIYGGESMAKQIRALEDGAQIVVGTPGRVLDLLNRRTLSLRRLDFFVLDEADEMLSQGFQRELLEIVRHLPKRPRQTMLFSATFPEVIERYVARHVVDPVRIALVEESQVAALVEHHYYIAPRADKDKDLVAVLDAERIESAIVFCNRRDETRKVANVLRKAGYHALPINSDLTQADRTEVMGQIKRGELTVLVATDIAARGIDISDLRHVVNYSTPESPEAYVHRTGRTGRLGKSGTAVTLVAAHELSSLKSIENIKGISIEERRLPAPEVIMEHRVERLMHDLKRLAALKSPEDRVRGDREDWRRVIEQLQGEPENSDVLYLLLQSFFEGVRRTTATAARAEVESFTRTDDDPGGSEDGGAPKRRPARRRTRRT
jgi:ATP-dependent RNA helicase DeaD